MAIVMPIDGLTPSSAKPSADTNQNKNVDVSLIIPVSIYDSKIFLIIFYHDSQMTKIFETFLHLKYQHTLAIFNTSTQLLFRDFQTIHSINISTTSLLEYILHS